MSAAEYYFYGVAIGWLTCSLSKPKHITRRIYIPPPPSTDVLKNHQMNYQFNR